MEKGIEQLEGRDGRKADHLFGFDDSSYGRDRVALPTKEVDGNRGVEGDQFLSTVFLLTSVMSFVARSNSLSPDMSPANDISSLFPSSSLAIASLKLSFPFLPSRSFL